MSDWTKRFTIQFVAWFVYHSLDRLWIMNNFLHEWKEERKGAKCFYALHMLRLWEKNITHKTRNYPIGAKSSSYLYIQGTSCLPFTKSFRKVWLKNKWNSLFLSFQWRVSVSNGTCEKVVPFFEPVNRPPDWGKGEFFSPFPQTESLFTGFVFRTESSKRKFVLHFLKPISDTSFRLSWPFFGFQCNDIFFANCPNREPTGLPMLMINNH